MGWVRPPPPPPAPTDVSGAQQCLVGGVAASACFTTMSFECISWRIVQKSAGSFNAGQAAVVGTFLAGGLALQQLLRRQQRLERTQYLTFALSRAPALKVATESSWRLQAGCQGLGFRVCF